MSKYKKMKKKKHFVTVITKPRKCNLSIFDIFQSTNSIMYLTYYDNKS